MAKKGQSAPHPDSCHAIKLIIEYFRHLTCEPSGTKIRRHTVEADGLETRIVRRSPRRLWRLNLVVKWRSISMSQSARSLLSVCLLTVLLPGCDAPPPASDEMDPLPHALKDFDPMSMQPGTGPGSGGGMGRGGGGGMGGGMGRGGGTGMGTGGGGGGGGGGGRHGKGAQDGTGGGNMDGTGGGNQKVKSKSSAPSREPQPASTEPEKGQ
jgi:hypothetical protein